MFKSFSFKPLKLKFAVKSTGNQRIFLQIFLWILILWTKIKKIFTCKDWFVTKKDTGTKIKNLWTYREENDV
jgi:hypothetical protein